MARKSERAQTDAQLLVRCLEAQGVPFVFGIRVRSYHQYLGTSFAAPRQKGALPWRRRRGDGKSVHPEPPAISECLEMTGMMGPGSRRSHRPRQTLTGNQL